MKNKLVIIGIKEDNLLVEFKEYKYSLSLDKDCDGDLCLTHENGFCSDTSDLYTEACFVYSEEWDYSQIDDPIKKYLSNHECS